jgi:hypothetical protein
MDFRSRPYGLSDVVINRDPPIRIFDRIYMKLSEILSRAESPARRSFAAEFTEAQDESAESSVWKSEAVRNLIMRGYPE